MPTRKPELSQEQFESISRAIADPRRYAILQQIAANPSMSCSALDAHRYIGAPTISHHIKELQEAGLIDVVREGRTAQLTMRRQVWQAYLSALGRL